MEKVYVIYEVREEDYVLINNLQVHYDCIKVFKEENKAKIWLKNELELQCDIIKLNGKIIYDNSNNADEEELWVANIEEKDNLIEVNIYYSEEWQNTIYLKEMGVE